MNQLLRIGTIFSVLTIFAVAAQEPKNIREVDFKNFTYDWDDPVPPSGSQQTWHWMERPPKSTLRLQDGQAIFTESGDPDQPDQPKPYISMDAVAYGDLEGHGAEDAAIHLNYSTGGTANWDYQTRPRACEASGSIAKRLAGGWRPRPSGNRKEHAGAGFCRC